MSNNFNHFLATLAVSDSLHILCSLIMSIMVILLPNPIIFIKKWANPGLFLFIFVLFSLQFQ